LVCPFEARWTRDAGPPELRKHPVTVRALQPPEKIDPEEGLLCAATLQGIEGEIPLILLEREGDTPQGRLLADYVHWMHNWGAAPGTLPFPTGGMAPQGGLPEMPLLPLPSLSITRILPWLAILGGFYGATLGALSILNGARRGMTIGMA